MFYKDNTWKLYAYFKIGIRKCVVSQCRLSHISHRTLGIQWHPWLPCYLDIWVRLSSGTFQIKFKFHTGTLKHDIKNFKRFQQKQNSLMMSFYQQSSSWFFVSPSLQYIFKSYFMDPYSYQSIANYDLVSKGTESWVAKLWLVMWTKPGGRLNKKDGLTRYGDSHVKDKTS